MPPLTSERFVTKPQPTPEELALRAEFKRKKADTYTRMADALPEAGFSVRGAKAETTKAVYKVDGQPRNEYTRAWLTGNRNHGEITVVTDRVRILGSTVEVVPDSQFEHVSLDDEGVMRGEAYRGIGKEKAVELLDGVNDTLGLIEETALAEAASNA